jgi:anti-sigma factor RsiW
MDCSAPPPLTEDQISAALDGVAGPDVQAHLSGCASCAERLARARRMEQGLLARMWRWDCPPAQRLADYHARRLPADEARALDLHLAGCASCAGELAELRAFAAADIPLAEAAPAPPAPWRSAGGALFARPAPQRPAVALRGAADGPLMAEAGDATIFLDLRPDGAGRVALQGQLVAPDQERWAGALVELRQAGGLVATATIDELGSFACAGIPPGAAELRITPPAGRMVVLTDIAIAG